MKSKQLQIAHFISERYPEIVNFWTAYNAEDLNKAIAILNIGLEEGLKREGWIAIDKKPNDKEYFEYKGKFYIQTEGTVVDVPLAQHPNELTEDAKQFMAEQAEINKMLPICPQCKARQVSLTGVCGSCAKGQEGFKSKYVCSCGYEQFFKETINIKVVELKEGLK